MKAGNPENKLKVKWNNGLNMIDTTMLEINK